MEEELNCFMQRQVANFSRLPLILDSIEKELNCLMQRQAANFSCH